MRCNESRLKGLLTADEDSQEFNTVSQHVESCSWCQQRLTELAADPQLVSQVCETLRTCDKTERWQRVSSSSVIVSIEAGDADNSGAECEPLSLEFLSPASHPEMLGRLGRYDIERVIGSGGMGVVLKGFDTELHRVVALKVLKPHLAHNGAARRRFAREAQSAAAVVHEHVIPLHDVLTDGETPFLVMQYVPGQSLQARVEERGPLDAKEVLRIGRQIAAGLFAAHAQGVVHRDVKPANILLEESVDRVLISDFGLARTVDDATLTRTGVVAGTPHYMSPEQATGQPVDHRTDLFSLGSVIYFMCTGRPPFRAEHALAILNRICNEQHRPVEQVNSEVPAELAEIVDCLLSKKPSERFRDAKEVELVLERLLMQLQNGHRSSRLRWRRLWLQWRATVGRTLIGVTVITACVFAGMSLSPWRNSSSPGSSTVQRSGSGNGIAGVEPLPGVRVSREESGSESGGENDRTHGTGPMSIPLDLVDMLFRDTFDQDVVLMREKIDQVDSRLFHHDEVYTPTSPDQFEIGVESLKQQIDALEINH